MADTYNPDNNYGAIAFREDRNLLDSELNEAQSIIRDAIKRIGDAVYFRGAVISGLTAHRLSANVVQVSGGKIYFDGYVESIPGSTLNYATKTSGFDYVYVEGLRSLVTVAEDPTLVNPLTGEATAERSKWVLSLKIDDSSDDALPDGCLQRVVIPTHRYDRVNEIVTLMWPQKTNLQLSDISGLLPGNRITAGTIDEYKLTFTATEDADSLLSNIAERTDDVYGSFVAFGLESFISADGIIETQTGRAYIDGYKCGVSQPVYKAVPASTATATTTGAQYVVHAPSSEVTLPYVLLNSGSPIKEVDEIIAILPLSTEMVKGAIDGSDYVGPYPFLRILSVTKGGTTYVKNTDWQQVDNYVDWSLSASAPAPGETYSITAEYQRGLIFMEDYLTGLFGHAPIQIAEDTYMTLAPLGTSYYLVTAINAYGESYYMSSRVLSIEVSPNEGVRLHWSTVTGATAYRIYRASENSGASYFSLIAEVTADEASSPFTDLGLPSYDDIDPTITPPTTHNPSCDEPYILGLSIGPLNDMVLFSTGDVTGGTSVYVTFKSYIGRHDVLCATRNGIRLVEGVPAVVPQTPPVPDGCLALYEVIVPPAYSRGALVSISKLMRKSVRLDEMKELTQQVNLLKYEVSKLKASERILIAGKKGVYINEFQEDGVDIQHRQLLLDRSHPMVSNVRTSPLGEYMSILRWQNYNQAAMASGTTSLRRTRYLATLPATEAIAVSIEDGDAVLPVLATTGIEPYVRLASPMCTQGRILQIQGRCFTPYTQVTFKVGADTLSHHVTTDASGRFDTQITVPSSTVFGFREVLVTQPGDITASVMLFVSRQNWTLNFSTETYTEYIRTHSRASLLFGQKNGVSTTGMAQTFSLVGDRYVSSIGVVFTQADSELPVKLEIRGLENGEVGSRIYAEQILFPSEITVNGETRFVFDDPVLLRGGQVYVVAVQTESVDYILQAKSMESLTGYHTLFNGMDRDTATAFLMIVYALEFESSGVIEFAKLSPGGKSTIYIDDFCHIPDACSARWFYSLNDKLSWVNCPSRTEIELGRQVDSFDIRCEFETTNPNLSPALAFREVNVQSFASQPAGVYVTLPIDAKANTSECTAFLQMNLPLACTVDVWATNNAQDDGVDEGWQQMTASGTPQMLDDGVWTEYTFAVTFTDPDHSRCRFRIDMHGTPVQYPKIHKLYGVFS